MAITNVQYGYNISFLVVGGSFIGIPLNLADFLVFNITIYDFILCHFTFSFHLIATSETLIEKILSSLTSLTYNS